MANGLYTPNEIAVMTDDALDELLSHYADTGNTEGVQRVQEELWTRQADREAEAAWEAEQEHRQIMHDEMIDDALARDGRWG